MSGGIAPSQSTVYVSNFSFSLTNCDLYQIFQQCGKIVKITIVKDRITRKSKGVAFIQFLKPEDALQCTQIFDGVEKFGRRLKCSSAIDNGRTREFIRKREYPDKSSCYECGQEGHLSYSCPKNLLGNRDPPKKKRRQKTRDSIPQKIIGEDEASCSESDDNDTLSSAIRHEQVQNEIQDYREKVMDGNYLPDPVRTGRSTQEIVKDSYFSDEEALDDDQAD